MVGQTSWMEPGNLLECELDPRKQLNLSFEQYLSVDRNDWRHLHSTYFERDAQRLDERLECEEMHSEWAKQYEKLLLRLFE
jgi:hypothetical protein